MKRITLWIVNQYASSPELPGITRHFDLSKRLVQRGVTVYIIASSFSHLLRKEKKLQSGSWWKIEEVDGVNFLWIKTFPYENNNWRRLINALDFSTRIYHVLSFLTGRLIESPDYVIGSSPHPFGAITAWRIARRLKARFIFEVRDLWPQILIDIGAIRERSPTAKILRAMESFLYKNADRIIYLWPKANEYLKSKGVKDEKLIYLPNGVDLSRFKEGNPPISSDGNFRIMYAGSHGRANALDVIIDAAYEIQKMGVKEIVFTLVGDGPEKIRLMKRAWNKNLKNVEFWDPVPKEQMPEVLKKADAFILHIERAEVFKYGISPNKLFEYMAMGRPVIFAVNSTYNIVEESSCGLTVPPCDPKALADAVINLFKMSPQRRKSMGVMGRQYVQKEFNWDILAERFLREMGSDKHRGLSC